MEGTKISADPNLATPAAGDLIPIVDISEPSEADQNKTLNYSQLDNSAPTDFIKFNLAASHSVAQGEMAWNADEETVDLGLNGAILQMGQEVHYHVRNNSGSLIPDGTAVMATGSLGASGRITIGLMDGSDIANAKFFLGVTTEAIANGTDGKVTAFGKVRGIKTDYGTWADGDVLWVDNSNNGDLTNIEPTSGSRLPIAFIVEAHPTNGTIAVRATDGTYLMEAHDTAIASPADGEVLKYNGTAWVNAAGGAFTADVDTQITPTTPIVLEHASNNEVALTLNYTTNKAAGNDTGLVINQTDTASPGTPLLADFQVGGASKAYVNNGGDIACRELRTLTIFAQHIGGTRGTLNLKGDRATGATGEVAVNVITDGVHNNTAGQAVVLSVSSTYNQASGTAANTDLLINRIETAIGSGAQLLIDAQVGGTTKFSVDNAGDITFGTHSALAAETLSGYITITDSGGTPRKIAVIT